MGGCPAENKDQLMFELIKIQKAQFRDHNFKDINFKRCRQSKILAAYPKAPDNLDLFPPSVNPTLTVLRNLFHKHIFN